MPGFSLIEMMIAMVVGMIVVAGAVSLIVAINKVNSETIQAIRLTQELRALTTVIADDIKRSGRVADPIVYVGAGSAVNGPFQGALSTNGTGGCVTYAYMGDNPVAVDASNPAANKADETAVAGGVPVINQHFRTIALSNGAVMMQDSSSAAGLSCGSGSQLNSPTLTVSSLCFSSVSACQPQSSHQPGDGGCGTCYFDVTTQQCKLNTTVPLANEVDICVAGSLSAGDAYMRKIVHSFVQPVFIRSVTVN
jgi:Tfp pilus assembly protein PilW